MISKWESWAVTNQELVLFHTNTANFLEEGGKYLSKNYLGSTNSNPRPTICSY